MFQGCSVLLLAYQRIPISTEGTVMKGVPFGSSDMLMDKSLDLGEERPHSGKLQSNLY